MYNLKLEQDNVVDIYLNAKNDSKYQGKATLLKFLKNGDSFFEDYEKLFVNTTSKTQLGGLKDKKQLLLNESFKILENSFDNKNPDIILFKKELRKICTRKNKSYNKMYKLCLEYKEKFESQPTHAINFIFQQDIKYIVRYIQQGKIKDWHPTLFKLERWRVRFDPQTEMDRDVLYNTSFTTDRWVKVLLKISPDEDKLRNELTRFTTYDGVSNYDRYLERSDDEESHIDDNRKLDEEEYDYFSIEGVSEDVLKEINEMIKMGYLETDDD